MDGEEEKVYVAVGSDLQDGFKTLEWTLRKWSSHPISIVILHVICHNSKGLVSGPYGKVPASSVSEEILQVIRKYEQEKVDKLLANYTAFCGRVKTEILKVEKYDEPVCKLIIDLISGLQITKFVMGLSFMKSSSGRSKGAISGAFYVHQNKPELCHLFIICGGKLVFLRGENEEGTTMTMVAKTREKGSFKGWVEKMLSLNSLERSLSQISLDSPNSRNQMDHYNEELEKYFQQLVEEEEAITEETDVSQTSPMEPLGSNMNGAECLRSKMEEARKTIQKNREQYKANLERCTKAEWAIGLCNQRVQELEARTKEEVARRVESETDLDTAKEEFKQVSSDLQERKKSIVSILELQSHMSNKLRTLRLAKSEAERRVERDVAARAEMVREIEKLRRQRQVVQRRIEFCNKIENEGMGGEVSLSYRNYTAKEMRLATNEFSERMRIKCGGKCTNVYRGRIDHLNVAIKVLDWAHQLPQQVLQHKVRLLSHIRHPHIVGMIGFCSELNCIVLEFMHKGSLEKMRTLKWFQCIRIAAEVATGLAFLHTAQPRPIVHGDLSLSNILLDRNLVGKITGLGLTRSREEEHGVGSDVRAFGVLMMELLAGPNWAGLVEDAISTGQEILGRVLEPAAEKWPLGMAEDFARIALKCGSNIQIGSVVEELGALRNKASDLIDEVGIGEEDNSNEDVPDIFLCPILKEVMEDPQVAADGFSYEEGAIRQWLETGNDRSPMTNGRLDHTSLTPNFILQSLIQDWHYQRSNLTRNR